MEPVAIVTALALFQFFAFSYWVGAARVKHGVHAPAITGHPEFERSFRVQQNTLEQLVAFLPALWIFGLYVHALIAAALGLLFIVGRFVYRTSYLKDPTTRSLGFGIGALSIIALLIGGLIGALLSWF
ncbi:MAG TPA: MAPEG family protein [Woeseiaceae bacterium]